jgi:hypothetical protein
MLRRDQIPEVAQSRRALEACSGRSVPLHPLLQIQQRMGNQLAQRLLQIRPQLEPVGSAREREADAVGRGSPPPSRATGRKGTALGGGFRLPKPVRSGFERRFGRGLGQVRVHSGPDAAASARGVNARAYTVGNDIVFGEGQYAPGTEAGRRLLAHELTHVVQQDSAPGGTAVLARQSAEERARDYSIGPILPPLHAAGLTFFPGPLRPGVLGSPIPVPASLRVTNALDVGAAPRFVLDMAPHQLVATFLDEIELSSSVRPGTPESRVLDPEAQQRTTLSHTMLRLDPATGRIRGTATLLVGSEYPSTFHGPTAIEVQIESTEFGAFTGTLAYGPLHADFRLRFQYDVSRLESAASPVFAPEGGFAGFWTRLQTILRGAAPGIRLDGSIGDSLMGIVREALGGRVDGEQFARQTLALLGGSIPADADLAGLHSALSELAQEFAHPGFRLTGGLGLGPIPLSRYAITAPTTRPIRRPLLGAPTSFPSTIGAYGTVIAPAGSITSVPVPAFGGLYSSFGERQGFSAIGGLLPSISTQAISERRPAAAQFPVYAFAEVSYVRRVSDALDLGLRLTAQVSTPEFFGRQAPSTDPAERFRQMQSQYLEARQSIAAPQLIPPTAGLTVFGRFGGPL